MKKNITPLVLPASLMRAAIRGAKADETSLDLFIAVSVAEKVGTLNTMDFLRRPRRKAIKS